MPAPALDATAMLKYGQLYNSMNTNQFNINKKHGVYKALLAMGESAFAVYPQDMFRALLESVPYYKASGVKIPTLTGDGVTVTTSRQAISFTDPSTGEVSSAFSNPVVATIQGSFTHVPSYHVGNAADAASSIAQQMANVMARMGNAADILALGALDDAVNLVDPNDPFFAFAAGLLSYTDSTSGGKLEEFIANTAIVLGQIAPICEALNQASPVMVIGSPNMDNVLKANSAFGMANSFDASAFDVSGIPYFLSNNVAPTAGAYAKGYFVNPNQIQACTFVGSDAKAGFDNGSISVGTFSDPSLGVELEARVEKGIFDLSAQYAGAVDLVGVKYTFTMNIAFLTTGNSAPATKPSGVLAVEIIKD